MKTLKLGILLVFAAGLAAQGPYGPPAPKPGSHWAYVLPCRPELPVPPDPTWPRNPIDHFVASWLRSKELSPLPDADARTLLRRLFADLLGLPPTWQDIVRYENDPRPDASTRWVEELLASPHFGERMAQHWLDLVRFADSSGYHGDQERTAWPYRDYVINAFNANLPFDRFTAEQLAGDLLPNATLNQRVASGYNRLHMTSNEGGAQAKEYLAKYGADRVRNLGSVWLGSTLACAECHDHKFDPFTIQDFYAAKAFFADLQEVGVGHPETYPVPTDEQSRHEADLQREISQLEQVLATPTPILEKAQRRWERRIAWDAARGSSTWHAIHPETVHSTEGATPVVQSDDSVLMTGKSPERDTIEVELRTGWTHLRALRIEALTDPSHARGSLSRGNGNFVLTDLEVELRAPGSPPRKVGLRAADADYSQPGWPVVHAIDDDPKTGWAVGGHERVEPREAAFLFSEVLRGGPGTRLTIRLHHRSVHAHHAIGRFRLSLSSSDEPYLTPGNVPRHLVATLTTPHWARGSSEIAEVAAHYRSIAPELSRERKLLHGAQMRLTKLKSSIVRSPMSVSQTPGITRVLPRGQWMDETGPLVRPAVPAFLPPIPTSGTATRRDLAGWIVAPENPLTARVFVNRLWKIFFGTGIVTTPDDFGTHGAAPSDPRLLDWLAVEFQQSGWDVKHIIRLLVNSRAYRQRSVARAAERQHAVQVMVRRDAESLRDQALAVSGLLERTVLGQSVRPHQPKGYWAQLNFPERTYEPDPAPLLYRRGLYTWWQRTFLNPAMLAFDAPTREECCGQRPSSSTPLQALVLLNDPTYVEAARALAERALSRPAKGFADRIAFLYREVLGRSPTHLEVWRLTGLLGRHLQHNAAHPGPAGTGQVDAWSSVTRVLLNLHETVTRT